MLRKLSEVAELLETNGIEYCIVGGMALQPYNVFRKTKDIDIFVSKETESLMLDTLYNHRFSNNKLFFKEIDVSVEGEGTSYITPNPIIIRNKIFGIWYISLAALIEMKLTLYREKDLEDVYALITANELDYDFATILSYASATKFLDFV